MFILNISVAFNINLSQKFKKSSDKKSSVDSNIVLNKNSTNNEIYSDIKLDLELNSINQSQLNALANSKDLKKITNEASVINSLRNIMNTQYETRLLNPEMQFDLRYFLFEPLTEAKGYLLGYTIYTTLPIYEPRIIINSVSVSVQFSNDCYEIILDIGIPSTNTNISLKSILSADGYSIME